MGGGLSQANYSTAQALQNLNPILLLTLPLPLLVIIIAVGLFGVCLELEDYGFGNCIEIEFSG